jgi:hypothetical protein
MKTMLDDKNDVYSGTVPRSRREQLFTFYHGTTPESAAKILASGFDLDAKKRHDSGDFGDGIYLTVDKTRAKHMGGPAILEVQVDLSRFAYIPNPYFTNKLEHVAPVGPVQEMFYTLAFDNNGNMATIHGDRTFVPIEAFPFKQVIVNQTRKDVCKTIRESFLCNGFWGIHTEYRGLETVVFNTSTIKKISWTRRNR